MVQRRKMGKHLMFNKSITIAGVILALWLGTVSCLASGYRSYAGKPLYVPNQVLVTLRGGSSASAAESIASDLGGRVVRVPRYSQTYAIELNGPVTGLPGQEPADAVMKQKSALLQQHKAVQSVDYNCYRYLLATPNDQFYPSVYDPLNPQALSGQWPLQPTGPSGQQYMHIYAPQAWDLQKGSEDVVVAVIDSGVRDRNLFNQNGKLIRIVHPDLAGRVLFGADLADVGSDDNKNPGPGPSEDVHSYDTSHGTHVAGVIAAQADNWIGIAGLCWDNVDILPLKICTDDNLEITSVAIIDAIYYAVQWRGPTDDATGEPLRVGVINMSFGGPWPSMAEEQAIRQAAQSGIICVASSGNEWEWGPYAPGYPAGYDDVICVGATGYYDLITSFSNRGRAMDIAAPGYNVLSTVWFKAWATVDDETDPEPSGTNLASTGHSLNATVWPQPNPMPTWPDKYGNGYQGYPIWSGTSMSAPHVSAAAALLLSHGVPWTEVKEILYSTATPKGIGRPNDTYGWGVLNVGAALKKASIDVAISSPGKGATVATTKPRFRIDFRHAKADTIKVWIDPVDANGDGVPESAPTIGGASAEIQNWQDYYYILDADAAKTYLLFEYAVRPERAVNGMHKVLVSAESDINFETPPAVPLIDTDSAFFRIEAQTLGAGWRLFSIPSRFDTARKPEEVLGTWGVLARWQYATNPYGEYALYSLDRTRTDEEATFAPLGVYANSLVHSYGQTNGTPPAGLGYWLYLPSAADVELPEGAGQAISDAPYTIGLYYGWNMVGNPFTFLVDWSNVVVEYAGQRVGAEEAVTRGWISDAVYRYDPIYSRYTFKSVSSAVLVPWEAEWVKVKVRTPELPPATTAAWNEEFNDGVLDTMDPEPCWFVGNTFGSVTEAGGMLRLTGTSGQPSYMYVTNRDYLVYGDFILDTKMYFADSRATVTGGPATAEVRFHTDSYGNGYSLSFMAGEVPNTISLRRSDTGAIVQSRQVNYDLTSGTVLYTNIMCVGNKIKIRVGTLPGQANVVDWELTDTAYALPGAFSMVNDGMMDCRWDYIRYRPVSVRPPDVKIIVPPNPYTGSL